MLRAVRGKMQRLSTALPRVGVAGSRLLVHRIWSLVVELVMGEWLRTERAGKELLAIKNLFEGRIALAVITDAVLRIV
jgi:hypothetical protein